MSTPPPPNSYSRGLHGVYRGRLVRDPRVVQRSGKSPMVTARIAVNLAAPSVPPEARAEFTEWVNVLAFSERTRHLLSQCGKGQQVAVMGGVSLDVYETRSVMILRRTACPSSTDWPRPGARSASPARSGRASSRSAPSRPECGPRSGSAALRHRSAR